MAIFAHLLGNTINNTLVAETLADAELATGGTCIDITDSPAGIGWNYDATTNTFIAPVVPTPLTEATPTN
jgi:hypothetical protein